MYNLCLRDDDCERGHNHEGDCGLAIRDDRGNVIRFIESEEER